MTNYKVTMEYDGGRFFGWQMQRGHRTVQGELERALGTLSGGRRVVVHGAGRTDTGVHALAQAANFALEKPWKPKELMRAVNAHLPRDVRVTYCRRVPPSFHARFSARRRAYRYLCSEQNSVLYRDRVWTIPHHTSYRLLRKCARLVRGRHDFSNFCKGAIKRDDCRCRVARSSWSAQGGVVIFRIEADRFLHHMIRYLVGTMIEVGNGRMTIAEFRGLLRGNRSRRAIACAPAHGLYLERVIY